MPVYNGSNYIEKTITYILENKSSIFELVLVNDGSKDDSLNICKKFARKDSRIKVVDKKNGGIADARNFGILNSNGEYLAFVDQDDYIEIDVLTRALEESKADIILFSTVQDYGSKKEPCDTVKENRFYNNKKDIFDNFIWPMVYPTANNGNVTYLGHVWQGIYKRNMITDAQISFKKFVSIEDDFIFLLEAFLASNSVKTNTSIGYRWVINLSSTTYKRNYIENMLDKCERYYSFTNNILRNSEFYNNDKISLYEKMSKQVLGVRLVINEGNNNDFHKSFKILKSYRKENRTVFSGNFLGEGAARKTAKYIFILLKCNFVLGALIFQKIIILTKTLKTEETKMRRIL